ncbi:hypothetical protein D3C75_912660 [compost metagenome]
MLQKHIKTAHQPFTFAPALGQKQHFAIGFQYLTHPGGHLGIKRFANITQDQPYHPRFATAQRRGLTVANIAKLLDRLIHTGHGGGRNTPFTAQHQGNGGHGYACQLRDVSDSDLFDGNNLCNALSGRVSP